jgi:hypothetical protein
VDPPLRVLVMLSSPHDYPALDVEQECAILKRSVTGLEQRGVLSLERIEDATLVALQHKLRRGQYHIFHYVGHDGFDIRPTTGSPTALPSSQATPTSLPAEVPKPTLTEVVPPTAVAPVVTGRIA